MKDAKKQFYDAILAMTFAELQEVASDFQQAAMDEESEFDIRSYDSWAWLFYGQAEGNIGV